MLSEELGKLKELHDEGALSDEEYEAAKARLLGQSSFLTSSETANSSELLGMTPSTYAMVMHLSQYATYVVPLAGVIIPIGLWLYARDQNEFINEHGRSLMNFLISSVIYVIACIPLFLLLIGFPLLIILIIVIWILPIVGAIAASKGQSYRYPMTFKFF